MSDKKTEKQKEAEAKKAAAEKQAAEAKKAAEKVAAEKQKAAEKAAAEAKRAAEKATKDAEREKEKAAKEAEKAKVKAAKDAERAAKEAEKEAAKATREAERAAKKAAKEAEREARKNQPRVPRVKPWEDMQPGGKQRPPREGSVFYKTLELMKSNKGATLEDIQATIGDKHVARRLLTWAHRECGYGFVMSPTTKKITALAPNVIQPAPKAAPTAN